jgi:hypothetical protein
MEILKIELLEGVLEGVYKVRYRDNLGNPTYMIVFASEEIQAVAKAVEAYQTNQEVIALQKLTGRIK